MFALQPWERQITYNGTTVEEMRAKEHSFKHFFQNVDALLRRQSGPAEMEVSTLFFGVSVLPGCPAVGLTSVCAMSLPVMASVTLLYRPRRYVTSLSQCAAW